jgi:hypothetical protein
VEICGANTTRPLTEWSVTLYSGAVVPEGNNGSCHTASGREYRGGNPPLLGEPLGAVATFGEGKALRGQEERLQVSISQKWYNLLHHFLNGIYSPLERLYNSSKKMSVKGGCEWLT